MRKARDLTNEQGAAVEYGTDYADTSSGSRYAVADFPLIYHLLFFKIFYQDHYVYLLSTTIHKAFHEITIRYMK